MPYHAPGEFHNDAQQIAAKILPHLGLSETIWNILITLLGAFN